MSQVIVKIQWDQRWEGTFIKLETSGPFINTQPKQTPDEVEVVGAQCHLGQRRVGEDHITGRLLLVRRIAFWGETGEESRQESISLKEGCDLMVSFLLL